MTTTKPFRMLSSLVAAVALAVIGADAHASVSLNGSSCQAYDPTSAANIQHNWTGAVVSGTAAIVTCPLARANPGSSSAKVNVYFIKGAAGTFQLYAYSLDTFGNVVDSTSLSFSAAAGQPIPWTTRSLSAVSWGTFSALGILQQSDKITMVGVAE